MIADANARAREHAVRVRLLLAENVQDFIDILLEEKDVMTENVSAK